MILSIHDFPIKIKDNLLINCKNKILLDFDNDNKEKFIQFIKENISAINDGRRVYKKRLTKTLSSYHLKDAIDIVKTEMFSQGYLMSSLKENSEIEYNIIHKYGKTKINFNKIFKSMDNLKEIQTNLENSLIKLFDAKTKENVNFENKQIALKDLIKLLNFYWENLVKSPEISKKGFLNEHQDVWYHALINVNKKVKYSLLDVTPSLWRCYIITLFGSIGKEDMLNVLTGWSTEILRREPMTYDMKIIFLSINRIIKEKEENQEEVKEEIKEENR